MRDHGPYSDFRCSSTIQDTSPEGGLEPTAGYDWPIVWAVSLTDAHPVRNARLAWRCGIEVIGVRKKRDSACKQKISLRRRPGVAERTSLLTHLNERTAACSGESALP